MLGGDDDPENLLGLFLGNILGSVAYMAAIGVFLVSWFGRVDLVAKRTTYGRLIVLFV